MTEACYCIALRKAMRRMTTRYDAVLEPIGINLAQFSLMRNIARVSPVSLTELGRITELDRSTIGRNVKVLERMGLAAVLDGKDQREATVALTDTGKSTLKTATPLWEAVQTEIHSALGDGSDQLHTLLAAL